ncbi:MAG: UGSC family (seleno)protein [Pseudoclavibacter sp.]
MAALEPMLDPTGVAGDTAATTLSPRPVSLEGLRVGLLDNTKPNATLLLEALGELLTTTQKVGSTKLYTKDYFGTPAKQELLDEIVRESDIVVTAVGDCGSCSAATVADGLLLEQAGVPTVSITSDSFFASGRAMATVQGFPDFEFMAVPHPVASLNGDEIRGRAEQALPQVLSILGVEA